MYTYIKKEIQDQASNRRGSSLAAAITSTRRPVVDIGVRSDEAVYKGRNKKVNDHFQCYNK